MSRRQCMEDWLTRVRLAQLIMSAKLAWTQMMIEMLLFFKGQVMEFLLLILLELLILKTEHD